jgi:hypothetical protein
MTVPVERENGVVICPLREADLPATDHIMRIALGTLLGVAMHRSDEPGFIRAGVYVLDDWR